MRPKDYCAETLVSTFKEIQPFLVYKVLDSNVNKSSGFFTVLIRSTPDRETIELYQKALKDRDISALPDSKYCYFRDCYNSNTGDSFCCSTHSTHDGEALRGVYTSHILKKVHLALEGAGTILPPDHLLYQDTELLAYHCRILCWKRIGETPKIMMDRVIQEHRIPSEIKAFYTCKLDPMACGIGLVVTGSQNTMEDHIGGNKVYRFQCILGVSTDSCDPLGLITSSVTVSEDDAIRFADRLSKLAGKFTQTFPAKSGRFHNGKPLWKHSEEGTLPADLPRMEREIHWIRAERPLPVNSSDYVDSCTSDIQDVNHYCGPVTFNGIGRIKQWQALPRMVLWKVLATASVSSGTFIRGLVADTGKECGIDAHAFRITRTCMS